MGAKVRDLTTDSDGRVNGVVADIGGASRRIESTARRRRRWLYVESCDPRPTAWKGLVAIFGSRIRPAITA